MEVSAAVAQDPQATATALDPQVPAAAEVPFAGMSALSEAEMNSFAGGASTVVVEEGTANVNDTSAVSLVSDNALVGVSSGYVSGNAVTSNSGFTTVINNSGSGAGIAVNTSVIINLQ